MRTVTLIQARYNSTRLRGKVLAELCGRTLLEHVVHRVKQATTVDTVCIATCQGMPSLLVDELYYVGSEGDVLDRFYRCALALQADVIVRVSGDSPLIGPEIVDECVRAVQEQLCDYATNTLPPETWPDGTDAEAFRFGILENAWLMAKLPSHREHVTPWIRRHAAAPFTMPHDPDLSRYRLCVDTPEDLEAMRAIMAIAGPDCTWQQAIEVLEGHPEIARLNQSIERNGPYLRQVKEEQVGDG